MAEDRHQQAPKPPRPNKACELYKYPTTCGFQNLRTGISKFALTNEEGPDRQEMSIRPFVVGADLPPWRSLVGANWLDSAFRAG
jgi:hypothetical protein